MPFARYTSKELSQHNTASDCWVVVHGKVLDITHFIRKHPGGVSALTKAGRAGNDVTKFFDDVQHSATALGILDTLQIGILDDNVPIFESESETASLLESTQHSEINDNRHATSDGDLTRTPADDVQHMREYSIRWHAARRKAILKDHPEIAALVGSNPWTCLIGALTVVAHCYACIICQNWNWYWSILLAYTVGAMCKMFQFAVCHDVCHDTAGTWLKNCDLLKRSALQLFTLPAMGGSTHSYYEVQHIGHHASLGSQALEEVGPSSKDGPITAEHMSKSIFFPDGDGDLFAVGTLSLGTLLQSWKKESIFDEETGTQRDGATYSKLFVAELPKYHKQYQVLKCFIVQLWHIQHHAAITTFFLFGLMVVPPFCIVAFLWPEWCVQVALSWIQYTVDLKLAKTADGKGTSASPSISDPPIADGKKAFAWNSISAELKQLLVSHTVRVGGSVGLHSWLWVSLNAWLLFGGWCAGSFTLGSVCKGFTYLYLSDLFLYGFGMHPYMGYFLGVHRSGGRGFESKRSHTGLKSSASSSSLLSGLAGMVGSKASPSPQQQKGTPVVDMAQVLREHPADAARLCQPTMSTYSLPAALATMNLTYHVEHHDFPGVPWSRLPQISQLAPEYYDGLEQSPGLWYTVYQWIQHSDGWGYACQ